MSESSAIIVDHGYKSVDITHAMMRPFEPKGMRPDNTSSMMDSMNRADEKHFRKTKDMMSRGKHFTAHGTEGGMRYVDFHFSPKAIADVTGVKHADFSNIHTIKIDRTSGGPYGVIVGHGVRDEFEPANTTSSTIYLKTDESTTTTPFHAVVDVTKGATFHLKKTEDEIQEEKRVQNGSSSIAPSIQRAVCFRKNMASTEGQFEYFTSSDFNNGISKSIAGDEANPQYIVQKQEGVPSAAYTYLTAKPNQERVSKFFERKHGVAMTHSNVNGVPTINLGPAEAVRELKDGFKTLAKFSSPVSRNGITLRFFDVENINPSVLRTHVSFSRDPVMEHESREHTTLGDFEKLLNPTMENQPSSDEKYFASLHKTKGELTNHRLVPLSDGGESDEDE